MKLSLRRPAAALKPLLALLPLLLAACATSPILAERAAAIAESRHDNTVICHRDDACAEPSPFAPMIAATAPDGPRAGKHYVSLIENGGDALALRLNLIASAQKSIDIQTFILSTDSSGRAVIDALVAAARRGVKVRLISDQLFSLDDSDSLAWLAGVHHNFEIRLYNPTFLKARTAPLEFAWSILCCFKRFNQRMHNKLFLIDGRLAISGGRNLDDRYFDLSERFNYRDRDVLVIGPATADMAGSFERFWIDPSVVPLTRLRDVADALVHSTAPVMPEYTASPALLPILQLARDPQQIRQRFVATAFAVDRVDYFADRPNKPYRRRPPERADLSRRIGSLIGAASTSISMETPYLVLSRGAEQELIRVRGEHPGLRLLISTNSLAATDAFYVYAVSYKYRRRYMQRLQPELFEFRPFAVGLEDMVEDDAPPGKPRRHHVKRREPVPLTRPGVRRGLHAKSIVIDHAIALIGSHNFDPRSDRYNTESGVIIYDAAFAEALEVQIVANTAPEQAWVVARSRRTPLLGSVSGGIERVSEALPVFDLWPFRYATSYALKPGCAPLPANDPGFAECYEPVGDFPEVNLSLKQIYTRLVTAFGSTLTPIL